MSITLDEIQTQQTKRVLELTASLQSGEIDMDMYEVGMEAAHTVAQQAILQWVADEVVQNEIRDETWPVFRQLEILKQHGWKGGKL